MKNLLPLSIIGILLLFGINVLGQQYQHQLTEQEKKLMPEYLNQLKGKASLAVPTGTIRPVAEFEPSQGVLIAYPFGIPVSLIAEMSEDVTVTTIVSSQSQESQVRSQYQSQGVNLSNCNFMIAPHDSYWTRDYGPLFIAGNEKIEIINFTYNRPRVNDNNIPNVVASFINTNVYNMNLTQTGGNYMTDGVGIAVSTDLVWDENNITHTQINQIMQSYLGVTNYIVKEDPQGEYIKHVDCWAKLLDVDKILIAKVPTSNPNYSKYEAVSSFFANQTSSWGNKFQVYRVESPNGEPYTNSLILNNKVLVPQTGSSYDDDAINAYKAAMPGYEIIGFNGTWESTDALHCRVHEIIDLGMLNIRHTPLFGTITQKSSYLIEAQVKAYSGKAVYSDSLRVYYKVNNGSYQSIKMTKGTGNGYFANIPQQSNGSNISYYIHAADLSGRSENHPYIGKKDPHVFTIESGSINKPVAEFSSNSTNVSVGATVQFTDNSTNNPTSWSWTFDGGTPSSSTIKNPVVTYNTTGTYNVSLTATNSAGNNTITKTAYIKVGGAGYCVSKGGNSSYEWISKVLIGTFSNESGASGYTDFSSKTINLSAGNSVNITLTPGFSSSAYNEYWKIWIDYNKNNTFDSNELAYDSGSASSSAVNGTIAIPSTATGTTRMRVSMKYNGAQIACESFGYGEVEDYTVAFGTVNDTEAPTAPTNLAATGVTSNSATISWNASTDNIAVTAYDIYKDNVLLATVTSLTYVINGLNPATTYSIFVKAKDAAGNISRESNTVSITTSNVDIVYCASKGGDFSYEWISKVSVGSYTKNSVASGYSDYSNETISLTANGSANISLSPGFKSSSYNEYWKIWIDFNKDGDFTDSGEEVYSGSGSSAINSTINIPNVEITTRMRVIMSYSSITSSCGNFSYGEVEDYTVNITKIRISPIREIASFTVDVFPNPNDGDFQLRIKGNSGDKIVNVYNLSGSLVYKKELENTGQDYYTNIKIQDVAKGMYIVEIISEGEVVRNPIIIR